MLSHGITEEMVFEQARKLAIDAVDAYLAGKQTFLDDRYGVYHGENGLNRAKHLREYFVSLETKVENKNEKLLTLFFAVFGVTTLKKDAGFFQKLRNSIDTVPGRSSKLASMIADKWINGEIMYATFGRLPREVTSTVFSKAALNQATSDNSNYRTTPMQYSAYRRFDKTKGVRHILENILNSPAFQASKDSILKSAEALSAHLQLDDVHFKFDSALLPQGEEFKRVDRRIFGK
jgi:hypothetical protein